MPAHLQGGFYANYRGETSVIVDEMNGGTMPLNTFKELTHPGSHTVPVKGSEVHWRAERIGICSNTWIEVWQLISARVLKTHILTCMPLPLFAY